MVTVKLQGGLCNQMFQIAAAIGLALRNKTYAVFDFDECSTENQGHPANEYRDTIYKNIQSTAILPDTVHNKYLEPEFKYNPIPYSENVRLEGYFQSEKYFEDCKDFIENLFYFDDEIIQRVKEYIASLNSQVTTVAVRRGDYLKWPDIYPICTKEYYEKAMALFPDNKFVFVSDDMDWVKENFKGENIFYSPFTEVEALVLLMCGDNNIIANSSFSWWGAWLNKNENKKVIAPSIWFGPGANHDTKDLYCPGWIII